LVTQLTIDESIVVVPGIGGRSFQQCATSDRDFLRLSGHDTRLKGEDPGRPAPARFAQLGEDAPGRVVQTGKFSCHNQALGPWISCRGITAVAKQQPSKKMLDSLPLCCSEKIFPPALRAEVIMQSGSVIRRTRKNHSDIWQFRWWETTSDGNRVYRRREIGTVEQIPDLEAARKAARLLVPELNAGRSRSEPTSMTIAQLCSHFLHVRSRSMTLPFGWEDFH
jgi:hypothetical protein